MANRLGTNMTAEVLHVSIVKLFLEIKHSESDGEDLLSVPHHRMYHKNKLATPMVIKAQHPPAAFSV